MNYSPAMARLLVGCGPIALSIAFSSVATAQEVDEPAAAAASTASVNDEIVVTAQQRSENIQDVPISIQAFSGETLEAAGVSGTEGLQLVTPGLTMSRSGNGSTPFIRGIGSSVGGSGTEAAVATYVDGVYREATYANTASLPDIERAEVLKGPQGTLYGRNTTGGLIHIITKEPSQDLEGLLSVAAGTYETFEAKAYLSGGLTETVAGSLSGFVRRQGRGYGRNLTIGGTVSERDEESFRGKLQFKSGDTKITLSADYSYMEDDRGYQRNVLPGSIVGLPGLPDTWTVYEGRFHDVRTAALPRTSPPDRRANGLTAGIFNTLDWGVSAKLEHSFGTVDLVSISAYRDSRQENFGDNDLGAAFIADALVDFTTKNFTQEVRLASNNDSRLSWIVGGFFLDGKSGNYLEVPDRLVGRLHTKSYSAFAELGLSLFDDAGKLTLGGRYTIDKRSISGSIGGNPDFGVPGFPLPPPNIDPSTTWKEPTYRIVYSHNVAEDLMVYASYNRGFKSGNYNIIPVTSAAYDPEIMDAYEVGFKSTLADGRVRLNAAFFYYDYQALQLQVVTNFSAETVNAAGAKVKGVDADLSVKMIDGLTLDAGASYVDGHYTDFRTAQTYVPNVDANGNPIGGNASIAFDASGKQLVRSPKFTASGGLTFQRETGAGEFTATIRAQYNSSMPWEPSGRLTEKAYTVVNFSAGHEWDNGFGLRIQASNIFNTKYSISTLSTNFGDAYSAADPATASVTASFKF